MPYLNRLDGFTPGERSLRARADKIYQNNPKGKDLYIRSYEAYELKASYLAAKEIVVGTWEGIRHPWDNTIVPLAEAVSSPVQTVNKVVMSYENWKAVRDEAYINDPQLAGRMDAMFDARVGANAAFMVVSGGTTSAIVRSPAAAKVVKSAGKGLTLVLNGKLKFGPSSLPSSALKAPVPIVRKAEAPTGKAVPVGEARIPSNPKAVKGTTVTLSQEQRLANGELIPKGSVITWSDNAVKVVRPDGSKRVFSSRDWEQKALPAPTAMNASNSPPIFSTGSVVQPRINLKNRNFNNSGWIHVVDRHLPEGGGTGSQFSISKNELRALLQHKDVVSVPVTRKRISIEKLGDGHSISHTIYERVVKLNKNIGYDKFNGNKPTNIMTIQTDKYGNLVTTTPGRIK